MRKKLAEGECLTIARHLRSVWESSISCRSVWNQVNDPDVKGSSSPVLTSLATCPDELDSTQSTEFTRSLRVPNVFENTSKWLLISVKDERTAHSNANASTDEDGDLAVEDVFRWRTKWSDVRFVKAYVLTHRHAKEA